MSNYDTRGPGEGTWAVFAEKVVGQRDALRRDLAAARREVAELRARVEALEMMLRDLEWSAEDDFHEKAACPQCGAAEFTHRKSCSLAALLAPPPGRTRGPCAMPRFVPTEEAPPGEYLFVNDGKLVGKIVKAPPPERAGEEGQR